MHCLQPSGLDLRLYNNFEIRRSLMKTHGGDVPYLRFRLGRPGSGIQTIGSEGVL